MRLLNTQENAQADSQAMPDDTTFLQRSKEKLTRHKGAVAGGGVSAATIAACFGIFVSQSNFNERMQAEKEARSVQWRLLQDQDNRLDALDKQVEIHKAVHAVTNR